MGQRMAESGWVVKIVTKAGSPNRRCGAGAGGGPVLLSGVQIKDTPVLSRRLSRSRTP